jgi:thiol-disulfide isomerase/thioredoxin
VNGNYLPDFQLPYADGSGQTWHLSDVVNQQGTGQKQGLILGMMASWCGYCRASLPTVAELQQQYQDQIGLVILSVDSDASAAKEEAGIVAAAGVTVPVLWADAATRKALVGDSQSIPRFFFVNKVAEVLVQDRGFGDKVRPLMPKQASMLLSHPTYMPR